MKSALIENGRRNWKKIILNIFLILFFVGMAYIFMFPVLYMLSVSVREPSSVNDPSVVWIPKSFSFKSITNTLEIMDYWNSLGLTLKITVGATLSSLVSCVLTGYGLARYNFKGRGFVFGLLLLTIIIPPLSIINGSYINFRYFTFGGILNLFGGASINLLNTEWTFILPAIFGAGLRNGLFIFIFRQFFIGMPKELEEASYIDGCNAFSTFVRVMLPNSRSAFITVMLFSFIWHWNDYYSAAVYFIEGVKPLSVTLYNLQSLLSQADLGIGNTSPYLLRTYIQSGALLCVLPPLVLYIFTQRYFTESIERTGIVG